MKNIFKLWQIFLIMLFVLNCGGQNVPEMEVIDVPVSVQSVEAGLIEEYVSSTGTIKPIAEAEILTEASGFFSFASTSNSRIQEGIRVKTNQMIAKLENRELVNNARVELKLITMETAEREYEKQKSLYEKGGVTLKEVQLADQHRVDSKYNYEASLIMMDKLNVKTPISGILVRLEKITEGDYVTAGRVIGKIMDYDNVYVEVNVSNTDIARIKIGHKAKVINYAISEEIFIGEVTEISRTIDAESRTHKVTIFINNPKRRLRPGMFVKVDIVIESKENAVLVPRHVVLNRNNRDVVFVVEKQRAIMKEVELGLEDKENIEIISGLEEGERIVLRGYETLKDKTRVTVGK